MIWHVQRKRKRRAKARRNPVSIRSYAVSPRRASTSSSRSGRRGTRHGGHKAAKTLQRLMRSYSPDAGDWAGFRRHPSTAGSQRLRRIKERHTGRARYTVKRPSRPAHYTVIIKNPKGRTMTKRRRRYRRNPVTLAGRAAGRGPKSDLGSRPAMYSFSGAKIGARTSSFRAALGGKRGSYSGTGKKKRKRRAGKRSYLARYGVIKGPGRKKRRKAGKRASTTRRRKKRAGRRPANRRRRSVGGRRMARRRRRRRTARNPWAGYRLVRGMIRAKRRRRPYKARRRHFRRQYRRGRIGAFAWRRAKRYGVNPSFRGILDMVKTSVVRQALPTAAGVALGRFIGGYLPMVPGVSSVTGMLGRAADPVLSAATLVVGGILTSKVGILRKFQPGIMTGLGLNVVYSLVAQFVPSMGGFFGLSGVYDTALAGYTADTAGYETVDGYETVGEYESVSGFEADVAGVEADLAGVSPFSRGYGNLRAPVPHRPAVAALPAHSMTAAVEPWTPASDDDAALYGGIFGGRRVGW